MYDSDGSKILESGVFQCADRVYLRTFCTVRPKITCFTYNHFKNAYNFTFFRFGRIVCHVYDSDGSEISDSGVFQCADRVYLRKFCKVRPKITCLLITI